VTVTRSHSSAAIGTTPRFDVSIMAAASEPPACVYTVTAACTSVANHTAPAAVATHPPRRHRLATHRTLIS